MVRVGYRDRSGWDGPWIWLVILGSRWLLIPGLALTWQTVVWLTGIVLVEVNAVRKGLRTRAGLTLTADGVTWHRRELFVPWSEVAALEVVAGRLLVRLNHPEEAVAAIPLLSRAEPRSNLDRHGTPIVLRAAKLTVPAETVLAAATLLNPAKVAGTGVVAGRAAARWSGVGAAGFTIALTGFVMSVF